MERDRYNIKLFDQTLAEFDYQQDGPGTAFACNLEINPETRHLLPLNMTAEPTNEELRRFLNTRRIPKNRAYIESILAPFGLESHDTKTIIDLTKGVSINDSYMVVAADDATTFDECNLFCNDFNVALQIAAYTGVASAGDFADGLPSELTASGSFPKAWRIIDGERVLFKAGGIGKGEPAGLEPYSEHLAWQVAQAMELNAVPYELACWQGKLCSTCRLMNTCDTSFVSVYAALPRTALERFNLNRALEFYFGIGEDESTKLLSMLAFDSVIANKDRHFGNFGVLRDNKTGKVERMAPLFDHNLSLFCQEPDSSLAIDDLLAARRRYTGAFDTNLETQFDYVAEDTQREQIRRLRDFEFSMPDMAHAHGEDGAAAHISFTRQRLDSLTRYIQHIAQNV